MSKRIYHYEIDLPNAFFGILKEMVKGYKNYAIVNQFTEKVQLTYIGLNAKDYIYSEENYLNIINKRQNLSKKGDYLKHIMDWLMKTKVEYTHKLYPFNGGALGFVNDTLYDYYENTKVSNHLPHVCFMVFDEFMVVDHLKKKLIFTYIGEYNKESHYNNQFVNHKQMIKSILSKDNNELEVDYENKIDKDGYEQIVRKFMVEKLFAIKITANTLLKGNVNDYDLFYSLFRDSRFNQVSFFKTTDFSIIAFNKDDYVQLQNNQLLITHTNSDYTQDLLHNQISRLTKISKKEIVFSSDKTIFDIKTENTTLEILHNFKLFDHNYGIPFPRNLNYIRRNDMEHRFSGLVGYIDYGGHLFLMDATNSIISKDQHVNLNSLTLIHNNLTYDQYQIEVSDKIKQIMDSII